MMLLKEGLLALIGLSAGGIIAAGVFAFIVTIGVVVRLIGKTHTAKHVRLFEDMIAFRRDSGKCGVSVSAVPARGLSAAGAHGTWLRYLCRASDHVAGGDAGFCSGAQPPDPPVHRAPVCDPGDCGRKTLRGVISLLLKEAFKGGFMDQEKQKAPDSRVGSTMSPEEYRGLCKAGNAHA